ncbi:magnesium/cobalt transporter CorA [Geomobilimonas luticola]|uniref:Magnesium transport protein CorA n=1 Tax=Geomobilimonas luticola TaxID=1114878 RepID=A0ABS5SCV7_9BACT|nr:magnesium/cobalt transporter CorA [Geomobilimonas luticola]MBT0653208.1 magnesium/cobalt transporter CorA [Geomobilimonas luticola]
MTQFVKGRGAKSGLPPGTLVHIGETTGRPVTIHVMDYDGEGCRETELQSVSQCIPYRDKESVTWINVDSVQQADIIQQMGECFGLHPLVMEDILNTSQRPKLEVYGDYLFIVMKMLHHNDRSEVRVEQISFILGPSHVLSFQEGIAGDVFDPLRQRLRAGKGRIRSAGADYLLYSLIDAVVDNYFVVLEHLGEEIEALEDEVVSRPTPHTVRRIHGMKRRMIFLRRVVWPLREVLAALQRGESELVQDATQVYLRDVYDHTIQAMDSIDTYRDMISGILDVYLSSLSNRMNEIMKFLTIIGTIFIPLTFIVGLYGMNFKYIPGLQSPWAFYGVVVFMAAIAGGMLVYFKRKRWL